MHTVSMLIYGFEIDLLSVQIGKKMFVPMQIRADILFWTETDGYCFCHCFNPTK